MLSQLDGQLTLEEIAVVCSLELADAEKIAGRLVELGAACTRQTQRPQREKRPRKAARAAIEEVAPRVRDPRSDDVSLRPPAPPSEPKVVTGGTRPERRRSSRDALRMQRASSRRMKAAKRTTPPPTRPRTERPRAGGGEDASKPAPPPRPSKRPSAKTASMKPPSTRPSAGQRTEPSLDRLRKLKAAAREIEIQARVEPLLTAAEEALKANDVIGAANNLRLALTHREDAMVRMKLEDVERLAKAVRLERSLACARAAENDERWADAATHLSRAHETKPTADIAARAAKALLMSHGDLERAAALAEQAVSLAPNDADHRTTLGEVYLAAGNLTRAATHAAAALELAPCDARARNLADAIARAKKRR